SNHQYSVTCNDQPIETKYMIPKKNIQNTCAFWIFIFILLLLFLRDLLQYFFQKAPKFLRRRDVCSFVRRVCPADGGPETYHFHLRVISADYSTFQTCVTGYNMWLAAEISFINVFHQFHNIGTRFWFPARVRATELNFHSRKFKDRFQLLGHGIF